MSFTPEDKEWLQTHFATKEDLQDLKNGLDKFATKEELDHKLALQAVRLEYHFDNKIDDLAALTAQSFTDLHEYLDENFQLIIIQEKKHAY